MHCRATGTTHAVAPLASAAAGYSIAGPKLGVEAIAIRVEPQDPEVGSSEGGKRVEKAEMWFLFCMFWVVGGRWTGEYFKMPLKRQF